MKSSGDVLQFSMAPERWMISAEAVSGSPCVSIVHLNVQGDSRFHSDRGLNANASQQYGEK